MSETPTLDKMTEVWGRWQAIEEFLGWVQGEKRLTVCALHDHEESGCPREDPQDPSSPRACRMSPHRFYPLQRSVRELLAEFFEVDLAAAEGERRKLLRRAREGA